MYSNNTTGYRGVTTDSVSGRFVAVIGVAGKKKYIGRFKKSIDAAIAYDKYADDNNLMHTRNF